MKIFMVIAAVKNYAIVGADAVNAYAQPAPPSEPRYVRVDTQYKDWYLKKFDIELTGILIFFC